MTIKERLDRLNEEDIVYLGNLITNFKGTEMYDLLSMVTTHTIMTELVDLDKNKTESAEKQLGKLQGIRTVLLAFDTYESFRDQVIFKRKKEEEEKEPLEEPIIKVGGGAI